MKPLNWGFRANNPLDYIGKPLVTRDNKPVKISTGMDGFTITLGEGESTKRIPCGFDNMGTCFLLNQYEVGEK